MASCWSCVATAITTSKATAIRSSASGEAPAGTMLPNTPGRRLPAEDAVDDDLERHRREERERGGQQAQHEDRRDVRPVRSRPTKEPDHEAQVLATPLSPRSRRVASLGDPTMDLGPFGHRQLALGGAAKAVAARPTRSSIAWRISAVAAPASSTARQKTTIASAAKTIAGSQTVLRRCRRRQQHGRPEHDRAEPRPSRPVADANKLLARPVFLHSDDQANGAQDPARHLQVEAVVGATTPHRDTKLAKRFLDRSHPHLGRLPVLRPETDVARSRQGAPDRPPPPPRRQPVLEASPEPSSRLEGVQEGCHDPGPQAVRWQGAPRLDVGETSGPDGLHKGRQDRADEGAAQP